jgi:Kef-type K+ transport system membrane component KefB
MKQSAVAYYVVLLAAFALGMFGVLRYGAKLPPPAHAAEARNAAEKLNPAPGAGSLDATSSGNNQNLQSPVSRLLLQLRVIIAVSRLVGRAFSLCGQPSVVGEMAAGILLGPSLFGLLSPGGFHFVFPEASLGTLQLLSQIGVCLFMFAVGMELDVAHIRNRAQTALVVSHASIVIPYFLGAVLACFLYPRLAAPGAGFTAFALFMGISMSITAFPVLARILQERGLSKTFLGAMALTCAAVGDVTAWTALAVVVAIARAASVESSVLRLVLVVGFIAFMVWGVRKALPRWLGSARPEAEPSRGALAAVVCIVMASALTTEVIGIHALFGAFLAGAIMPETGGFRHKLSLRIENFSSVLLLPLFFVFTGLRTQVGLLNDMEGWLLCLLIIAVATLGKLGGTAVTARLTGMGWRDALQLGALMNTRGLMELIALNIGFDLGILSPRIFTMLVIMALATTVLTGPLLTVFGNKQSAPEGAPQASVP